MLEYDIIGKRIGNGVATFLKSVTHTLPRLKWEKPVGGLKMNKTCRICGETKPLDGFVKRTKTTYRSECKSCYNLNKRRTPLKPTPKEGHKYCAKCNEQKSLEMFYFRYNSNIKRKTYTSYCKPCEKERDSNRYFHQCEMCKNEYHTGKKDSKICVDCHRDLMRQDKMMYKYKKRDFRGEKNSMYGKQRFGEENPNYKHGLSDEERYKKRLWSGYGLWRKKVYEKDNYTCQCCFKESNGDIEAHHLDGYSWCEEKRLDIRNGVTLCKGCHAKFHEIYGKFNVTRDQFIKFRENLEYL